MSSLPFGDVIHALDLEEPAWIEALFHEGRSLLDEGQGLFVYSYRVGPQPSLRLGALAGDHTAPRVWQTLSGWGNTHARALARAYVTGAGGIEARSGDLRAPLRDLLQQLEPHAIADVFTLLAHDPNGFGVFLTVPQPRKLNLNARRRRSFERLAAELGAALRLREARREVDWGRLSASERTVTRWLASGASDKEIKRSSSPRTVAAQCSRIFRKCGVAGRRALAAAMLNGGSTSGK